MLVGTDIVHAQRIEIAYGHCQSVGGHIVGRAGLKLQGRTFKGGMLETDMLYHLSPTLVRWKLVEPGFLTIQHAYARGAIHLVAGESEEVAVKILHVYLEMRGTLRAIHKHGYAVAVCIGHHLLHGVDGAEDVAHVGKADEARMLVEELAVGGLVEGAVVEHGTHTKFEAIAAGLELPRHDVAVMLHHGDDDLVARLEKLLCVGGGNEVDALRGAAREDNLGGASGIDKLAHGLAGLLVELGGLLTHPMDATVDIGIDVEILVAHGVQYAEGLLRGGGVVEVNQRFPIYGAREDGKIGTHL